MNIVNILEQNLTNLIKDLSTPNKPFNAKTMLGHGKLTFELLKRIGVDNFENFLPEDYGEFLLTPYWKIISQIVKEKYDFKCAVCNSTFNLHCHHKNYDNHYFEHEYWDTDLICLCSKCHNKFHEFK